MTIDSHVHVWSEADDPRQGPIPMVSSGLSTRRRAYALDQVDDEMTATGITGVVLVQATSGLQHTEEMLAMAAAASRPTKVVGWAPLGDPADTAMALRRYAGHAELVGIRQWHNGDDHAFLRNPAVVESIGLVAEAGLTLDILPWPTEVLEQIPGVARRYPGMPIVTDLLGWPQITAGRMQPWTDHLAAAAAEPNVHVKLGGLYLRPDWQADPDDWRPYVETLMELFGADRIMIGTSWPVMTMSGRTYTQTITALRESLSELIDAEREHVLVGTAARVYRFDPQR